MQLRDIFPTWKGGRVDSEDGGETPDKGAFVGVFSGSIVHRRQSTSINMKGFNQGSAILLCCKPSARFSSCTLLAALFYKRFGIRWSRSIAAGAHSSYEKIWDEKGAKVIRHSYLIHNLCFTNLCENVCMLLFKWNNSTFVSSNVVTLHSYSKRWGTFSASNKQTKCQMSPL